MQPLAVLLPVVLPIDHLYNVPSDPYGIGADETGFVHQFFAGSGVDHRLDLLFQGRWLCCHDAFAVL